MKILYLKCFILIAAIVFLCLANACVGPDYTPDYFGMQSQQTDEEPEPSGSGEVPAGEAGSPVEIFKIVVGKDGRQIEAPVPSRRILEVSSSTFISRDETEIGPKFTTSAKFKIVNIGDEPIELSIPSQKGAFFISSLSKLNQKISPDQFIILTITFKPSIDLVSTGGKIVEEVEIAGFTYELAGIAVEPSGSATINVVDESGNVEIRDASLVTFDEISLSAHPMRKFFRCSQVSCNGDVRFTECSPCIDMLGGSCELLIVNRAGEPIDAVDNKCSPATNDTVPASEINLSGTELTTNKVQKKIIEILNTGTEALIIKSIEVRSSGEFDVNPSAVFVAEKFDEIKGAVQNAFQDKTTAEPIAFPIVLPPYDPPIMTTRLYTVVSYNPIDIVGSDGMQAAVGSSAKDEAILSIRYEGSRSEIALAGTTTIKEIPALQVYVKTSTGVRPISNNDTLPFKGVTSKTADLSVPLFMKLSDSATLGLRITSISFKGTNFEWLDTADKIGAKPEDVRCTIPVLDESGSEIDTISNPEPVSLNPNGFSLEAGAHAMDTMPFFGCINFTRDPSVRLETSVFSGEMMITAQELTSSGQVALNPDGAPKETVFTFGLLGVIDPLKGMLVMRLTQTMAGLMVPQFPAINSAPPKDTLDVLISEGRATEMDRSVFLMSMILDPYDEETILNADGSVASTPGDGVTAIFQPIDTRAVPVTYDDPFLADYTSLIHDSTLQEGLQGIFTSYPNMPEGFKTHSLKIYSGTLSYPGPLAPSEEKPSAPSQCEIIDACTTEGQRKLSEGPSDPSYNGVCAYFHVTAGSKDSPAFYYPNDDPPGNRRPMCEDRETPYDLNSIKGKYYLDGRMEFDNLIMLFQGPTYFHNPSGPLGPVPPLDELFSISFTTETLLPISETKDIDRIPDKRVDIAKGEYKINLNDPYSELPQLCENNLKNELIGSKYYSTWKYLSKLLKKDKEGKTPAGCPEEDNNFTGGIAYLTGRRLDHDTGQATFIGVAKFSSNDNLTFAFKDVIMFMVLNGWFCDPTGLEDEMEGAHCYDKIFNYRDAQSQFSIMNEGY